MEAASREQVEEAILPNDHLLTTVTPHSEHDNVSGNVPVSPNDENHDTTNVNETDLSIWEILSQNPDQITAMLSNYSTSFNVVSISIVLPILETKSLYYDDVQADTASMCASALIAGMVIGQLIGGALGDLIGRQSAMFVVMCLQIVSSLGSSILVGSDISMYFDVLGLEWSVFQQLSAWRFVLGIGCGGVYPLAALLSSESQSKSRSSQTPTQRVDQELQQSSQERVRSLKMLATTFSMQGVGFVSVPIIGILLLQICGMNKLDYAWRLLHGFGSVPGMILLYLRYKRMQKSVSCESVLSEGDIEEDANINATGDIDIVQRESNHGNNERNDMSEPQEGQLSMIPTIPQYELNEEANDDDMNMSSNQGLWNAIKEEDDLVLKIVATAGTWFLFDIVFYGNTLFQPIVIKAAFGYGNEDMDDAFADDDGQNYDEFSNLVRNIRDSGLLSLISLPGYFTSIALIGSRACFKYIQTPSFIQIQGFFVMAILYSTIAWAWDELTEHHWLLLGLYGGTFFFSNYGPNTTTFMLPSLTFSPRCRSTLNGICAASGKAGALIGSIVFEPVSKAYGDSVVMFSCAIISILGGFITFFFCKGHR